MGGRYSREWEAGIPGNGREREFPLTPVMVIKVAATPVTIIDEKYEDPLKLYICLRLVHIGALYR